MTQIAIRIGVALLSGIIIGFEREITHHPAGLKTHTLVSIGAALCGLITSEMALSVAKDMAFSVAENAEVLGRVNLDISRIAAGVVTGIGFIGAGAIMKSKDGTVVTGITTAATLWVTACLGFAVGMGYLWMSLITLVVVFASNVAIKYLENNYLANNKVRTIDLIVKKKVETMQQIEEYCSPRRIKIRNFEYTGKLKGFADGEDAYNLRYSLKTPSGMSFLIVMRDLATYDNILQVIEKPINKSGKKSKQSHEQEEQGTQNDSED